MASLAVAWAWRGFALYDPLQLAVPFVSPAVEPGKSCNESLREPRAKSMGPDPDENGSNGP